MYHKILTLAAGFTATAMLASCAPVNGSSGYITPELTQKQQNKLDRLLAGRTAGEPVSCITQSRGTEYTAVSDDVLVYEYGGVVYVNRPVGGCIGAEDNALVTRQPVSRLCSGDIAQVEDFRSGGYGGSCAFSEFTPYYKTDRRRN